MIHIMFGRKCDFRGSSGGEGGGGMSPGLPDFTPQYLPKRGKIYQLTNKYPKRSYRIRDQMVIKDTNLFLCKTLYNLPKLGFLVWKMPSGNPECRAAESRAQQNLAPKKQTESFDQASLPIRLNQVDFFSRKSVSLLDRALWHPTPKSRVTWGRC
jgi:hypothetical protein